MLTSRYVHRIQWGECDPFGIVYFPRYMELFDVATHALFETAGVSMLALRAEGVIDGIPLVTVSAAFHSPAGEGDELVVESRIARWGDSSFDIHHEARRESTLIVSGTERRVWTRRQPGGRLAGVTVPEDIRRRFEGGEGAS